MEEEEERGAQGGCFNLAPPQTPPPSLAEPLPVAGGRGFRSCGTLLGRTMSASAAPTAFSRPAHGSVPAVLQRKAPLPPLCIMTNQGRQAGRQAARQAAVPLAHHSTAIFFPFFSVGEQTHKAVHNTHDIHRENNICRSMAPKVPSVRGLVVRVKSRVGDN